MLNSTLGRKILDGFLRNQNDNTPLNLEVSNLYLGLLTLKPNTNEEELIEGGGFCSEPAYEDYRRIQLTGASEGSLMSKAVTEEITDSDGEFLKYETSITNKDVIMFPEVIREGGSQDPFTIRGFGIFEKQKTAGGQAELPLIWGDIKNVEYEDGEYKVGETEEIEIAHGDVPVIPPNFITISIS